MSARLLDVIRCSITFRSPKHMIDAAQIFVNLIDTNVPGLQLSRIKNGFANIDIKTVTFVNLKINVIFTENKQSIIGEVQFQLKDMLDAKKKSYHVCYF